MRNELDVREYLNEMLEINSFDCACHVRGEMYPEHYQRAPHTPSCKERRAARHAILTVVAWILQEDLPVSQRSPEGNYVDMPLGLTEYEPRDIHRQFLKHSHRPEAIS